MLEFIFPAVARSIGSSDFVTSELYALAAQSDGVILRTALGNLTAKALGKLLRRAADADADVGGYKAERIGDNSGQGIWRVLRRLS
jgi:hypothetical protein